MSLIIKFFWTQDYDLKQEKMVRYTHDKRAEYAHQTI